MSRGRSRWPSRANAPARTAKKIHSPRQPSLSRVSVAVTIARLIPVEPVELSGNEAIGYIYEPGPVEVLEKLLPRYIEMEVYHAVLEAIASEHSARMVAMKNATDAANDLIDDLTLRLNKARQEAITSEMLDIVGGVEALN